MRFQRICISLLLLVTIVFAVRPSFAQSITTLSTVTTVTSESSATQYSVVTSGANYQTTTVSPTILDRTLQITAPTSGRACYISPLNFDVTAGEQIAGNITATSNIQLFLLRDVDYQTWNSLPTPYCNPDDNNIATLADLGPATTISWQWTPPTSGTYWFLAENFVVGQSPNVHILLVSQPVATTVTNYVYATIENALTTAATETLTLYQTQGVSSQNVLPTSGDMTWVAIPALIIIIIIAVAVFMLKSKSKRGKTSPESTCPKCGAKLPPKAKFCKKCGASVG